MNCTNKLLRSQGKYNSNICFIFNDEEHYKSCKKSLDRILSVYGINMWDIIVLYCNKTDNDNSNIETLLSEICIINPKIVYIFDNMNLNNKILLKAKNKVVLAHRTINVNNVNKIVEENISTKIFDLFEYLITYNY